MAYDSLSSCILYVLSRASNASKVYLYAYQEPSQVALVVKNACQCRRCNRCRLDPWVGKSLWSRKWQPTLVFLPGKFHGQRSLMGYSLWSSKRVGHDWACTHHQETWFILTLFQWLCWLFCSYYLIYCFTNGSNRSVKRKIVAPLKMGDSLGKIW